MCLFSGINYYYANPIPYDSVHPCVTDEETLEFSADDIALHMEVQFNPLPSPQCRKYSAQIELSYYGMLRRLSRLIYLPKMDRIYQVKVARLIINKSNARCYLFLDCTLLDATPTLQTIRSTNYPNNYPK